ncbi:hypothetical protein BJY01DRAFT_245694 [Aspergillus pseudoustus]|uniref:ATP-dependent helicase dcl2 n=1 Tax=Aspergillus pseudoustus TaxID=1810923 RepID=A0ABR4KCJ7_9EURO
MASIAPGEPGLPAYRARNYQLEMFEASLKDNIIVAMGTGSGKTHIALLRIMHELENSDGNKLIWFLAPTVALCLQQHKVISQHIPAAKSRTLTGLDKVELWTEQAIWDAVLQDVQVVLSTHAVLLDAMTHGFVRISQLGLIIFDEAHHCVRKHPANKIMQDFYHPTAVKFGPDAVPRILGLTASAGSSREELLTIESNLNSTCTTPQAHRQELLTHTHRPELQRVLFTPVELEGPSGGTRTALLQVWKSLDLESDPYVKKLRRSSPHGTALQKALETGKTYCMDQLKRFVDRVDHIYSELGSWAADYFIWTSLGQLRSKVQDNSVVLDLGAEERRYLVEILSQLPVPDLKLHSTVPADFAVSPKFEALISFLMSTEEREFSGLIFVQQRATVAVMAHLLSVHPSTRDRFRTGSFIGMSTSTNRKDFLGDLWTVKMQRGTLDDFRGGRKNLIVATDVLEEGIDVSACSVVVCYNRPPNLKSFLQRRGRARRQHSTYAILLSTDDDNSHLHKWHDLERVMEEAYQDDQRRLEELRALETIEEDVDLRFCVESTGAILTADNAAQHLYHFCSTLPSQSYVDNQPEFSFEQDGRQVKCKVTLPSCVHPDVRRTEGHLWWLTERAARKEAAFQAYKALYEGGLVNDNLLPLTKSREFTHKDLALLPAIKEVSEQYDPWVDWAYSWSSPDVHQSQIVVRQNGAVAYMKLVFPTIPPTLEPMTLFWDEKTTYMVEFEAAAPISDLTPDNLETMRAITALYLQASTTQLLPADRDYINLFGPDLPEAELASWLEKHHGHDLAEDVFTSNRHPELMGVVRDRSRFGEVLLFKRWVTSNPSDHLSLECDVYPKRRNLLQRQTLATKRSAPSPSPGSELEQLFESPTKKRIITAAECTIDRLPAIETIFGRFIAVIIDRLEAALVAAKLCETVLYEIHFTDPRHVITAITMPLAQAPSNYQRYEFFGDSVLKFTVSFSLFYQNPTWHEGYLSEGRDAIVQNGRLARAALNTRLDSFIIGKTFTPKKWAAPLISEKMQSREASKRELSTKVLADVVEALIGAAYIDGGHSKAQACLRRFLPEIQIITPEMARARDPRSDDEQSRSQRRPHPIQYEALEGNIGYTFTNKALLIEALTHPSCQHDSSTQSYQRLEFLGDAVLDMIIVDLILAHPREISQGDMTRIKHALVNANLLAFFCLEFGWAIPTTEVTVSPGNNDNGNGNGNGAPARVETVASSTTHHLYTHLRHSPTTPLLTTLRTKTLPRHQHNRSSILAHLNIDSPPDQSAPALPSSSPSPSSSYPYPWTLLSALHSEKFLSDIIESLIGAIFIDSVGDMASCTAFLERLGLLRYARHVLDAGVDVVHPMQRAQILAKSDLKFHTVRVVMVKANRDERGGEGESGIVSGSGNGNGNGGEPEATYTCTATLPSRGIPDIVVNGYLSAEQAEVQAAEEVIRVLSGMADIDDVNINMDIGDHVEEERQIEIEVEGKKREMALDHDMASEMEF